ncbi:MAG: phosphoribosylglycinamide formyltransferase [Gemmatimonadota bacterium]
MRLRAAVFASGRGSNFEVLADRAASTPESAWEVVLLVTDRAEAGAVEAARARSIETSVIAPQEGNADLADRMIARLQEARVDLVLLAGYLRLIPPAVVEAYRGRMLNLHPALLPGFGGKGMYGRRVHQAVLDSGARISGATIHLVDEAYDRGRILAQWPVPVLPGDTAESLQARVCQVEHLLYPAAVDLLARSLQDGTAPDVFPRDRPHFRLSDQATDLL